MAHAYRAVGWNRAKRRYDLVLVGGVLLYLAVFAAAHLVLHPDVTAETLLIRGFGGAALILLHVILCIGPLCRLDRRWLPLLYNRRHLGVTMFLLALVHGGLATFQFHALGDQPALLSLLSGNGRTDALAPFPFELLGVGALLILFLMAATSHDFWLAQLTAPVWKALHMLVYAAYGLLVMHVALGSLQDARLSAAPLPLVTGLIVVLGLHLGAGWKERRADREAPRVGPDTPADVDGTGWADVAAVGDIAPDRAVTACVGGERVAVFRHAGGLSAVSSVCRHQGGPLGEGRVLDGCITCPWHGYQYLPESGRSPPPFDERVPTFRVAVRRGRVLVHPTPLPPGTPVTPAPVPAPRGSATAPPEVSA